jgi:hypothetical protein
MLPGVPGCARALAPPQTDTALLYAVIRIGRVVSIDPVKLRHRKALDSSQQQQRQPSFAPYVEGIHVPTDASGAAYVFPVTLATRDVVCSAAAADGSTYVGKDTDLYVRDPIAVVWGAWSWRARSSDGAFELTLLKRFSAAATPPSRSEPLWPSVRIGDDGSDPLAVPCATVSVPDFLRLAATRNPPWLQPLYAEGQLGVPRLCDALNRTDVSVQEAEEAAYAAELQELEEAGERHADPRSR